MNGKLVILESLGHGGFLQIRRTTSLPHDPVATGNSDDALDILQDSMLDFVRAYPDKPPDQLKLLFTE